MKIGPIAVGDGAPLALIAGLNVIEGEAETLEVARLLREIAARHDLPLIFKASFDKANRSSFNSFRGPGLDEGLRVLARVKAETGLPITTDVHEPGQAKPVAEIADCLQIPAFLCRQTDLVAACAATGKPVNFKKGQFVAPLDMRYAVEKARHLGAQDVLVTERVRDPGGPPRRERRSRSRPPRAQAARRCDDLHRKRPPRLRDAGRHGLHRSTPARMRASA